MDTTDKIISVVIGLAVVSFALPLAFGFINDANWTLTVGETSVNTVPLIILMVVIVVLGVVVMMYRAHK